MISNCKCPADAALTDIPNVRCAKGFGQIQKVAFQRLTKADGTRNSFTTTKGITKKASWTALMAATDDTKIVITPYIYAPTNEPGEARTTGGGNETPDGIETVLGGQPSPFTGAFHNIPQNVIAIIKKLMCEASAGNLGVYLFDNNAQIEALEDEATAGTYYPIPIRSLFVSDKGHGGLEADDTNNIQWAFPPNYSDTLAIVSAEDFNPVRDLITPEGGD